MASTSGGDPGGSNRRTLPLYMDPHNEFGAVTTLLMTGKDGTNLPIEPFIIGKSLEDWAGPIEDSRSVSRCTKYVIRTRKPAQVEKLLKMTHLCDGTEVSVVLHPTLNISRCVISAYDVIEKDEQEIVENLSSQGVIKARRILKSNKDRTAAIILTFNKSVYPANVKIGVLNFKTRPYYPNPMLCFSCFEYGHPRLSCTNSKRCYNCSQDHEEREKCEDAPFCRNCEKDHRPTSRQCPIYKKEMEVIKTKIDCNLTEADARKRVEAGNGSYARIAAQPRLDQIKLSDLTTQLAEKQKKIEELESSLAHVTQVLETKFNDIVTKNAEKDTQIKELLADLKQRDERIAKLEAGNQGMKKYIEDIKMRARTNSQSSEPSHSKSNNKKHKTKRTTPSNENDNERASRSNMSPPPKKQPNTVRSPILTRNTINKSRNEAVDPSETDDPMHCDSSNSTDYGPSRTQ